MESISLEFMGPFSFKNILNDEKKQFEIIEYYLPLLLRNPKIFIIMKAYFYH
jgi:hypothetical protein